MKSYFVEKNNDNVADLQNALAAIVEFAYFMAEESNSEDRIQYINEVLRDNHIIPAEKEEE